MQTLAERRDLTVPLTAGGRPLDRSPDAFGWLRASAPDDPLREHLEEDGYLFVPGVLDRDEVLAGRLDLLHRVQAAGALDPAFPLEAGIVRPDAGDRGLWQSYPSGSEPIMNVLRGGRMMGLFEELLGGQPRAYDFVWLRDQPRGTAISPHCDIVFMGRGTPKVLTCWTPFGDIALGAGGLIILEGSHRTSRERAAAYLAQDVDTYCENGPNADAVRAGDMRWERWDDPSPGSEWGGELAANAVALREQWGGRWLTAPEFRMGDVLVFTMSTVHGGTDNNTDILRLSTDSRYQLAAEPIDDRWITGEHGEPPVGHGVGSKRGKIC
jgi:hypothetical protein